MFDREGMEVLDRWKNLAQSIEGPLEETVREIGVEAMEQMTHNLSGQEVDWRGGSFRINVVTGNLRRHVRMEHPLDGDPHAVLIFNNAEYAQDIEEGVSGFKKVSRLIHRGKTAKISKKGRKYKRIPASKGSLIPFWTVTEDSRLRDLPARPFSEATEYQMKDRAAQMVAETIQRVLVEGK